MANTKITLLPFSLAAFLAVGVWGVSPALSSVEICYECKAEEVNFHGVVLSGNLEGIKHHKAYARPGVPGEPPALETRFNMGSMMKIMTAVGVLQLVEKGLVDLDSSIRTYLADLPESYQPVTVHHLLTHTGGAGNYLNPRNMGLIKSHKSLDDLKSLVVMDAPEFTPGEKFAYSNSGFVLLGMLIEAVSGQSYEAFMQNNIFKPGGMTATGLLVDDLTAHNYTRMSPGMRPGQKPPEDAPYRSSPMNGGRGMPAGGTYSTAHDLYLFAKALLEGKLISSESLNLMTTPPKGTTLKTQGGERSYGYGAILAPDGSFFGHGGGGPGVNAELRIWKDSGEIIVTLTNLDPPLATQMAGKLGE